jgi:hypothetical protein
MPTVIDIDNNLSTSVDVAVTAAVRKLIDAGARTGKIEFVWHGHPIQVDWNADGLRIVS